MNAVIPRQVSRYLLLGIAIAAVLIASVIILHWQGRLWICACGRVDVWAGNTKSSDNSQHLLDPYSFTHVLHGLAFYGLAAWLLPRLSVSWKLWATVTVEAAWEMVENSEAIIDRYRQTALALGYNGDTIVNSLGDIACCVVGFYIARRLGWRWSLLLFIVTEIVLALWIRDGLVLNIISLIYPVDAISTWQRGQ